MILKIGCKKDIPLPIEQKMVQNMLLRIEQSLFEAARLPIPSFAERLRVRLVPF